MSPRYEPLVKIAPPSAPPDFDPPDVAAAMARAKHDAHQAARRCSASDPYVPGCPHSFFADLLRESQARQRGDRALDRALELGGQVSAEPEPLDVATRDDSLERVRGRLKRVWFKETQVWPAAEARDMGGSGWALRPTAPGWIADVFGQASRQTGTLVDALGAQPLEPGMLDTNASGFPIVPAIPLLSSGAAVAVQTSQNAAISEVDPVTAASEESPVATLAGQVDYSRQLLDFSQPRIDGVIADDLGRDFGTKLDAQIVNGSGGSGQARGLLNWTGILSVTGSVATVQGFVADLWQAFASLSGSSGIGNPDPDAYVTIVHPRRLGWMMSGAGDTSVPAAPNVPGRLVASAGIGSAYGSNTNEDVALIVERESVDLLVKPATFRVDEDSGSSSMTVRTYAWTYLGVVVRNPAGIAKVAGLTPPTWA